jgi:CheY-like chemotaxis protein
VTARSGDAALKALLSDEFAVILLDVLMPGMDGFETAAHIKRRPRTRDVPIIFLTALNSEPDYAFRSYSAGAVDYIAKPFDPWVLRAKVSVFVDLYMKNRQLSEQAALLHTRMADSLHAAETAPATAEPVLAELSARLAAVEDMVTVLSEQIAAAPDPAIPQSMHQLEHRLGRLRDVLDALRVGGLSCGSAADAPAGWPPTATAPAPLSHHASTSLPKRAVRRCRAPASMPGTVSRSLVHLSRPPGSA